MSLLEGKVVLITGAGGGLGRAHALLMASEGARVVVNDLGVDVHGDEPGEDLADKVVAEIREAGGEAVANKGSVADVEEAEAMVRQAVEQWGRLDVVVNNAGILRDKTILKMDDAMWNDVIDVHLNGTFWVTRAAMHQMDGQEGGGTIINTTSLAGLKGNFGQANYGAAKAGIAGLTRVAALEGKRSGVTVNAIAPVAKTRMTDDIAAVPEDFEPEDIAPLVAWLASDEAREEGINGQIFGAHGAHYFEYRTETTPGVEPDADWTPAEVGRRIDAISEMPEPQAEEADEGEVAQVRELFAALPETFDAEEAGGWEAVIQFNVGGAGSYLLDVADGAVGFEEGEADDPDGKVDFDSAQTLLDMATGKLEAEKAFMAGKVKTDSMGVLMKFSKFFDLAAAAEAVVGDQEDDVPTIDPARGLNKEMVGEKYRGDARLVKAEEMIAYAKATEADNPQYLDEEGEQDEGGELVAPPIFPVKLFHPLLEEVMQDPELNVDILRLVHGEQDMRFHRPLEPKDLVAPRARIASIEDKSTGQLLTIHFRLMCAGELVTEADTVLFIRNGASGTGSKSKEGRAAKQAEGEEPARELVHEEGQPVADDQPARYADASGDRNPIHLDPDVAEAAGLPDVILHGLCTMAFAGNAVVDGVCEGDSRRLKRLKVRFSKPVLPGQTVNTRVFEEGRLESGRDVYAVEAVNENDEAVLENGVAEVE